MIVKNIIGQIKNSEDIVIAGHINPDGDCVSSCLAMALSLKKIGKTPKILLNDYSNKFDYLKGTEFIYKDDYSLLNPELFIALDCAAIDRLGDARAVFERAKNTICLDHHISNSKYADLNYILKASSACEVCYEVVTKFVDINLDIATAIYTGIVTDTNGFMHNITTERTHIIAADLIRKGVDFPYIHQRQLYSHSMSEVKILSCAVEKMQSIGKIVYTTITLEDMKNCNATNKDLDGIVNYILNIDDFEISVFVYEKEDGTSKISFRSKGKNVSEIAQKLGGGGHIQAAGANFDAGIEKAVEKALSLLKEL